MKTILCIFLTLTVLSAAPAQDKLTPIPSNMLTDFRANAENPKFEALHKSKIQSEADALKVATQWLFNNGGMLAEESISIAGLHKASRRAGGYSDDGNWIWELQLSEFGSMLSGVILVDAQTGNVYSAIPNHKKANKQLQAIDAKASQPEP